MTSETEDNRIVAFSNALRHVLEESKLTITQLAKEASLSRQYFTLLKQGDATPSTTLLRKVCAVLQRHGVAPRDLTSLVFSAIGIDATPAFYLGQPFTFTHQGRTKPLKTRCILTDILAECIYDSVLTETIDALQENVGYFYFLARSSPDWERMLAKASTLDPRHEKLLREKSYCIRCPDSFVYSRMRIDNIHEPEPSVYISLGPSTAPALYHVQREIVITLVGVLATVIEKATRARTEGERNLSYKASGIELSFELED